MAVGRSNLLLIGGSGRHIGKTTLARMIIRKISPSTNIIGLKVSTLRQNEERFHGDEHVIDKKGFKILTEDNTIPHKDTALMITEGAKNAYYLQAMENSVEKGYLYFEKQFNPGNFPVICESRALRKHIIPGLFILIIDQDNRKDDTGHYEQLADYVITYQKDNLSNLTDLVSRINYFNGWKINNK